MKTTLIIARHGNTFEKGDTPTRVGKHTDIPLTQDGLKQGEKIGAHLKKNGLSPSLVYSSNLQRTIQTAETALTTLELDLPITPLGIFDEIDYGPDENKTEAEVVTRIGQDAINRWNADAIVPSGWLVNPDSIIQAWNDFGDLCTTEHAGKTILIITSNGVARFAPHLTGEFDAFKADHDIKLSTGALAVLEHDDDSWQVKEWNLKP